MEAAFLRLLLLIALFFLLTGDYASMLSQLAHFFGGTPSADRKSRDASRPQNDVDDEPETDLDENIQLFASRSRLMSTIKNSCLPKLICEINAQPHKDKLTESEKSLLALIRDTSISVTAEVTSKYHFAAHMGQLIAGVDGTGCHNFYPSCPFPGLQVLTMMKKVKLR